MATYECFISNFLDGVETRKRVRKVGCFEGTIIDNDVQAAAALVGNDKIEEECSGHSFDPQNAIFQ